MEVSSTGLIREREEYEADRFATHYLMPRKQVLRRFGSMFGTDRFMIDEDNAFNLMGGSSRDLEAQVGELRDLSRVLAGATSFGGSNFESMASLFRVSVEAMAIRLEELQLVGLEA